MLFLEFLLEMLTSGENTLHVIIMEELYKKYLSDLDNHDGVISHSKSDILKHEIKWTL